MEVFLLVTWLFVASAEFDYNMTHIEAFLQQKNYLLKKKYRPMYHITAPVGWLNDPDGFIYFKQRYHIFYQYHPFNGVWGPIHWGHVVSENLINWSYYPPALIPKEGYDHRGCLSGSAVIHDNCLILFYTGNLFEGNRTVQCQNIAVSTDGIVFQKYFYNPVLRKGPFGNTEFRNPVVWSFGNHWYMLLGSSDSKHGSLLLYTSLDLFNWSFNKIVLKSVGDMGYMWENPDIFQMNGLHVLILSVQGMSDESNKLKKLYQTGYFVGKFNYNTNQFDDLEISTETFRELDYGHDFYAAKTTLSKDGRRLLVAWLGQWSGEYIELQSGWVSMLTIVRELKLNPDGILLITPVKEMIDLRSEVLEDAWYSPGEVFCACTRAFELIVNTSTLIYDAAISLEWTDERQFIIAYSPKHNEVMVNRGGVIRKTQWLPSTHIHWRIFVDYSSIEVFCGNGEVVFSSRIYPKNNVNIRIEGDAQLHITQYKLKRSIGYNKSVNHYLKNTIITKYNV